MSPKIKRSNTKKVKLNNITGVVHIQSTFNNTIVTITDTIWNPAGGVRAYFLVLEIRVECIFSMNTYL